MPSDPIDASDPLSASDPIDRAHLTGRSRPSPPIHRYRPGSAGLAPLVLRYWVPVWSVTEPERQSTLQYPVCLVVVSNTYARLYGVVPGLSTVTLEGDGWAFGTMLAPAAGRILLGRSVATLDGSHVELSTVEGLDGRGLTRTVRAEMTPDPADPERHRRARAAVEAQLSRHLPIDAAGRLVNEVVEWVWSERGVTRVDQVCARFAIGERALQRLVSERCGISPKWLIQRRRLHEAVGALKSGTTSLGQMAADLGYADQAHFTHDFRRVTGMTPGEYLSDQRSPESVRVTG